MDDDALDPLDLISSYGLAGSFIEARLARLQAQTVRDTDAIDQCTGMSDVVMNGLIFAVSCMDGNVTVTTTEDEPAPLRG